ncbi:MAG: cysteine desulfurase family protein [Lagierella massiliensis]|nr:cysteine desulfurase family protein [Lagierella massiliensis]
MIYFDYAATSLKRKEIFEDILKNFDKFNGNPHSLHGYGRQALRILDDSRKKIANSLNFKPNSIVFNSGASEGNNAIIRHFTSKGYKILCSKTDHPSILNSINKLNSNVQYLKLNNRGEIDLNYLKSQLTDKTLLILTLVNNETGLVQELESISDILKDNDTWLHIDNVQGYGHLDFDFKRCDSMSLSGHKIGGINGFGILYMRKNIDNLIYGGEQEKDRRGGTSFVIGAYSMAKSYDKMILERNKLKKIKLEFIQNLKDSKIPFEINGNLEKSSDHILNLYFPFIKSDLLLTYLDINGICASAGSACSAGTLEQSHVIEAIYGKKRAEHSIRFSFGFTNTPKDVEYTVNTIKEIFNRKAGDSN